MFGTTIIAQKIPIVPVYFVNLVLLIGFIFTPNLHVVTIYIGSNQANLLPVSKKLQAHLIDEFMLGSWFVRLDEFFHFVAPSPDLLGVFLKSAQGDEFFRLHLETLVSIFIIDLEHRVIESICAPKSGDPAILGYPSASQYADPLLPHDLVGY